MLNPSADPILAGLPPYSTMRQLITRSGDVSLGSVGAKITVRHGGVSPAEADNLFKVARGFAIPIFVDDRRWWDRYVATELDPQLQVIVNFMIFGGSGKSGTPNRT